MRMSRKKSNSPRGGRRRRRRRRRQGGGAAPLHPASFNSSNSLPLPPFEPPGGMYKPGGVNGLDGGYYYGVNVDQSLPDPISTSALFRQNGGRKRTRCKRKSHRRCRHTKRRRRTRRRKRRRRTRRRKRRRRSRRKRGGWGLTGSKTFHGSFKRFLTNIIPKDVLDVGYKSGHKVGNLYRGYVGARPKISTDVIDQPIDRKVQTLGYQPIDSPAAYNDAIEAVNTGNTPDAQANYQS